MTREELNSLAGDFEITNPLESERENDPFENMDKVVLCYSRNTGEPVYMYEEDRFLNTIVVGPTGSGKSSQILLPLIYQDIINEKVGITIFDPKEDLAEEVHEIAKMFSPRKVIYVDPLSPMCPKVNPFFGEPNEVITTLSKIFVSGVTSTIEERSANDMTRILISKSIKLIVRFPILVENNLNIRTFSDFISNKMNAARMKIVQIKDQLERQDPNSELIEICDWFLKQFFATNSRANELSYNFQAKIEEIASNEYLSNILTPTGIDSNIINFDEALSEGHVVIINTRYSLLGHMAKTFGEFLLRLYMTAVFRRKHYQKKKRADTLLKPNYLYIDEFATFSPISTDLFTQGRSFRVGTTICIQNMGLLKVCGEQDSSSQAVVIEANTRNIILFPGLEGDDAKFFSEQMFNFAPEEILYRPFGQIVHRIIQKRNIQPPEVGLVFFITETPHMESIKNEFVFRNGRVERRNELFD